MLKKNCNINRENSIQKSKVKLNTILIYLMITFLICSILQKFIFYIALVPTESMQPNINPNQRIFVNKIAPNYTRGSVVLFNYDPQTIFCKRLIGLPNDFVEIKERMIFINGEMYKEPFEYLGEYTGSHKFKLKENEYFVLGDNREHSKDSRVIGPIKDYQLVGSVPFTIGFHPKRLKR